MRWRDEAACRGREDLNWFGPDMTMSLARLCQPCPVRPECLFEALQREEKCDPGIWGGTTEIERRHIRRDRSALKRVWVELERAVA